MSKRISAKFKASRRLGVNLWGKAKDPSITKNYPPGQHGSLGRKKLSDYGNQLRAKQQLKRYYANLNERQFLRVYKEAIRRRGDSGEWLVGLLESRLDALVYRANFVPSMFAARQFVNHKHVTVNGKVVNIASYQVKVGDVVQVRERSRQIPIVLEATQKQERTVPEYIEVDNKAFTATFKRMPVLSDIPYPVLMEPNLVIEFYSR